MGFKMLPSFLLELYELDFSPILRAFFFVDLMFVAFTTVASQLASCELSCEVAPPLCVTWESITFGDCACGIEIVVLTWYECKAFEH